MLTLLSERKDCSHETISSLTFSSVSNSRIRAETSDKGTSPDAGLFELRNKLVAVIGFDRLGVDLHDGTKMRVHQPHEVDLLLHVGENCFFRQTESVEDLLPPFFGRGIRILLARFGDLGLRIGLGGVLEGRRLHLLREQFLIDQAVEHGRGARPR